MCGIAGVYRRGVARPDEAGRAGSLWAALSPGMWWRTLGSAPSADLATAGWATGHGA